MQCESAAHKPYSKRKHAPVNVVHAMRLSPAVAALLAAHEREAEAEQGDEGYSEDTHAADISGEAAESNEGGPHRPQIQHGDDNDAVDDAEPASAAGREGWSHGGDSDEAQPSSIADAAPAAAVPDADRSAASALPHGLQALNVKGTGITERGVQQLLHARSACAATLQRLDVSETTGVCLDVLRRLPRRCTLQSLRASGCKSITSVTATVPAAVPLSRLVLTRCTHLADVDLAAPNLLHLQAQVLRSAGLVVPVLVAEHSCHQTRSAWCAERHCLRPSLACMSGT